ELRLGHVRRRQHGRRDGLHGDAGARARASPRRVRLERRAARLRSLPVHGGRRRGRAALGAAVALHRFRRREDRRRRAARGADAEGRRARLRARVRGPRRLTLADERWAAVDRYLAGLLVPPDAALDDALRACADAGMPAAGVSPTQGKLLQLLARLAGAHRILELGTLGGYSSIWLARALPDGGRLVTLEADPGYAEVARSNIDRAGLSAVVEIRVGPALETLP